jgi:hypothetical protein
MELVGYGIAKTFKYHVLDCFLELIDESDYVKTMYPYNLGYQVKVHRLSITS